MERVGRERVKGRLGTPLSVSIMKVYFTCRKKKRFVDFGDWGEEGRGKEEGCTGDVVLEKKGL